MLNTYYFGGEPLAKASHQPCGDPSYLSARGPTLHLSSEVAGSVYGTNMFIPQTILEVEHGPKTVRRKMNCVFRVHTLKGAAGESTLEN